nr:hypothetical protein [uncultured Bacteroides sp.]
MKGIVVLNQNGLKNRNVFKMDNVEIEVTTIHSVKGGTHISTLYLETNYQGEHEGSRIIEQLIKNPYVSPSKAKDTYRKETLKMLYVGQCICCVLQFIEIDLTLGHNKL